MTDRTCTVGDCDRRHVARGLCRKHYNQEYAARLFRATPCTAPGCPDLTSSHSGRGMCDFHYTRALRGPMGYSPRSNEGIADTLGRRTEQHGDCILWTGALSPTGYGLVNRDAWGHSLVHRAVYELHHGPIPPSFEVDHLCHTADPTCVPAECLHRRCVNPSHLEAVTHDENMRRQVARTKVA